MNESYKWLSDVVTSGGVACREGVMQRDQVLQLLSVRQVGQRRVWAPSSASALKATC